jgi:hypothetical protein
MNIEKLTRFYEDRIKDMTPQTDLNSLLGGVYALEVNDPRKGEILVGSFKVTGHYKKGGERFITGFDSAGYNKVINAAHVLKYRKY